MVDAEDEVGPDHYVLQAAGVPTAARISAKEPTTPTTGVQDGQEKVNVPSVHDGPGQMMGPPGHVVVRPQARIDLRNDDLLVPGPNGIDLFAEQRRRVDAVGRISTSQGLSRGTIWCVLIACSSSAEYLVMPSSRSATGTM